MLVGTPNISAFQRHDCRPSGTADRHHPWNLYKAPAEQAQLRRDRGGHPAVRAAAAAAPDPTSSVFCLGVDGVICDLSDAVTATAWHAAMEVWPGQIPGSPAVFQRKMREVRSAVRSPHDNVILIRLLAEEGTIGGRSIAGRRQGPVVGRSPSRNGTRGLLAAEIVAHWSIVREAALQRWSCLGPRVTEQQLAQAYDDQLHGFTKYISEIRPHQAVVEAINGFEGTSFIMTALPPHTTRSVLDHCGVQKGTALQQPTKVQAVLEAFALQPAAMAVHVVEDRLSQLEILAAQTQSPRLHLHLADWGCSTPSMRARASTVEGVNLITDTRLAELMGVTHLTAVMDGIAWK